MGKNISPKDKATISLVLGIVSLVIAWYRYTSILGIILAIVGILFAVEARKELPPENAGMATAGMVCSIIALVLSSFLFVACVLCIGLVGAASILG